MALSVWVRKFPPEDVRRDAVNEENELSEEQLWEQLPGLEGAERADVLIELSHEAYKRGAHHEALALCECAKDIYDGLGAQASGATMAHIYTGIGWTLKELNRPKEAAEATDRAVAIYREIGLPYVICTLRVEGSFWFSAKEYEKSMQCYQLALAEPQVDADLMDVARDVFNIASALLHLEKWEDALGYYLDSRARFKTQKAPLQVAFCDEDIAHCYVKLGNGPEAMHYAQKALDFGVTADDDERIFWSKFKLGQAKKLMQDLDEGEKYLLEAKALITGNRHPDWKIVCTIERDLADILTSRGQVEEAGDILRRIATIEESLEDEAA